jgi:serine/threonine protein kinase
MAMDTSKPVLQTIGNYDLLAKIAEGGMGTVYKGRNRQTGQIVAIKIVPPHMANNQVLLKRFEQEFRAASTIDHPNIVRALDYCGHGSTPFLVMEFVEGESLGQKIEREGRIPEAEAIRIIAQACQGLHRAHKMGLIHRDVKPDNIMITPDGQAKVTDLGLVKEVEAELNLTRTGRGLGTPHFMAPEQFRNAKNADVRCDIYSLGATLYMMVTGELPFKSCGPLDAWMKKVHNEITPPRKLVPTLSERVDWAIRRAMSADQQLRPQSCREFVEDLTGHSTRRIVTTEDQTAHQDLWYLVYRDEEGTTHTVKGSTEGIRRSLREGLLGDASNVRACRTKTGPFEPLRAYPEFRDIVMAPTTMKAPELGAGGKATPASGQALPRPAIPQAAGPASSRNLPRVVAGAGVPPADGQSKVPHIRLETRGSQTRGLLKWLLLFAITTAASLIAFRLFFK